MTSLEFNLGVGAGLALAGLLYLALWWWTRRTTRVLAAKGLPRSFPSGAPEGRHDREATSAAASSEPAPPVVAPHQSIEADPVREIDERPAERPAESNRRAPASAVIRLSQRVILHVYSQGVLAAGAVAPPGLCQAGIGEALGISQGGLAAALRRLEAAGILMAERGHVQGRDRRLKVYRLSARGHELARELRARSTRRAATSGPVAPTPTVPSRPRRVPPEIGTVGSRNRMD